MKKNPNGRILRELKRRELKEQHLSTISKSCKNNTSEHLGQFSKRKCVLISTVHSLIFFIYFLGCGRLINI